jgi:hypothetical protein
MNKLSQNLVVAALLFSTAIMSVGQTGCGSNKPAPVGATSAGMLDNDGMVSACVRLHTAVQSCTPEFVGMNLDLRSQYSPEFASMMKDPAIRAEAENEGAAETAADAAQAPERCKEFAKPEWGPPQPKSDVAVLEGCYAKSSCAEKMACIKPIIEPRFAFRARAQAQNPNQPH